MLIYNQKETKETNTAEKEHRTTMKRRFMEEVYAKRKEI